MTYSHNTTDFALAGDGRTVLVAPAGNVDNDDLIPAHGREGMRPHYGTDAVVGIGNTVGPFPEGGGAGVLQRTGAAGDRHYLRAQQPHPINVQCLPLGILLPP